MTKFLKSGLTGILTVLASLGTATSAMAHHPMGGEIPTTLWQGLLSGVGHPIIGIDHLAFVIAVGLAALFTKEKFFMPLLFVMTTMIGCFLYYSGIFAPIMETAEFAAEIAIAFSVLCIGMMIVSGKQYHPSVYSGLFAAAGIVHGFAYGGAILGAESTPLVAYLIGFGVTQYTIAIIAMSLGTALNINQNVHTNVRLAGAVIAGVGATFFIEHIEGLIFTAEALA